MIEDGIYPRYDPGMSHHRLFLDPPEFEFSRRWQHCGDPLGILATARPAAKFELGKLSHLGRGNNARDGGTEREREGRKKGQPASSLPAALLQIEFDQSSKFQRPVHQSFSSVLKSFLVFIRHV